jgi:hypothetical protein
MRTTSDFVLDDIVVPHSDPSGSHWKVVSVGYEFVVAALVDNPHVVTIFPNNYWLLVGRGEQCTYPDLGYCTDARCETHPPGGKHRREVNYCCECGLTARVSRLCPVCHEQRDTCPNNHCMTCGGRA